MKSLCKSTIAITLTLFLALSVGIDYIEAAGKMDKEMKMKKNTMMEDGKMSDDGEMVMDKDKMMKDSLLCRN